MCAKRKIKRDKGCCFIYVVREGFSDEVTVERRPEGKEGGCHVFDSGKTVPDRG